MDERELRRLNHNMTSTWAKLQREISRPGYLNPTSTLVEIAVDHQNAIKDYLNYIKQERFKT